MSFPKACGCGAVYSRSEWLDLPLCGRTDYGEDVGDLELRNCRCGSTISVLISDLDEDAKLEFEITKMTRILRLYKAARKALDLAGVFALEAYCDGRRPGEDHRVVSAVRQVRDYRRAIARLRAMQFQDVDSIVEVCLREEFAA